MMMERVRCVVPGGRAGVCIKKIFAGSQLVRAIERNATHRRKMTHAQAGVHSDDREPGAISALSADHSW
jgi:hypothetical protein